MKVSPGLAGLLANAELTHPSLLFTDTDGQFVTQYSKIRCSEASNTVFPSRIVQMVIQVPKFGMVVSWLTLHKFMRLARQNSKTADIIQAGGQLSVFKSVQFSKRWHVLDSYL